MVLQLALVAVLLGGLAWIVLRPHEPLYKGRPFSEWMYAAREDGNYFPEAQNSPSLEALRALNTNVLPILVRWVGIRRTIPNMILGSMAQDRDTQFLHLPRQLDKGDLGVWGIEVLGTNALPALPGLAGLLDDPDPFVRFQAARSLAVFGESAAQTVSALLAAFRRPPGKPTRIMPGYGYWGEEQAREAVLWALGEIGPQAERALNVLSPAATTNLAARLAITRIKGESFGPFIAGLANPATNISQWQRTAQLVARLGTNAEPAVPFLISALESTNANISHVAIDVLGRLHLRPEICVPALLRHASSNDISTVMALRRFGPLAKAAVPYIEGWLLRYEDYYRQIATNALLDIDPEAAARAGIKPK